MAKAKKKIDLSDIEITPAPKEEEAKSENGPKAT